MYGAIIGDICGSIYEWNNLKTENFAGLQLLNPKCFYTDDSILTCAVADAILHNKPYHDTLLSWARQYPNAGYGTSFRKWFNSPNPRPYHSFGNGSAMRVSPVGWAFSMLEETLSEAKKSAEVSHNHKEGIKGAQAVAAAIFMAQNKASKDEIRNYITKTFHYKLNKPISETRPGYYFHGDCQNSVPQAITVFLDSKDFISAVQLAISIGGDSDTIACIAGSIAEAFYRDVPKSLIDFANSKLPENMQTVISEFENKYGSGGHVCDLLI